MNTLLFEIKYYLYTVPKDWYYDIKWFFGNLKRFWSTLWKYRTYDYAFNFNLFADSLEWLAKDIEGGMEDERAAKKKVVAIRELVSLLRELVDDEDNLDFGLDIQDYKNLKEYNEEYIKRKTECINRIARIINGQNCELDEDYDTWVENFDGTGYEGWWE